MSGQYPNTFYRVAVKALIKNNKGEILLVKEKSGEWDLPGGGLDHGETPEDGIRRELFEELGVADIVIGTPALMRSFWLEDKQAWLMWAVYHVVLSSEKFKPGDGVTAIEYINPKVLLDSDDERESFISKILE